MQETKPAAVLSGQEMMIKDGLPPAAVLPEDQRRMAWLGRRLRPTRSMHFAESSKQAEDPATKQLRKELAAAEEKKKAERFARLKELKQSAVKAALPKETTMTTPQTTTKTDQVKALRVKRAETKGAKKAAAKPAKKAAAPKKAKADVTVRPGTKLAIVVGLLTRKEGCTTSDVLKATDWPSVSMPQQAKAAGLKLRKEKPEGGPTRYYGSAA
jgi:rubrerythrin